MLIGIKSLYDVGVLILGMGMTSACFQQNGKTLLAMQKFINVGDKWNNKWAIDFNHS